MSQPSHSIPVRHAEQIIDALNRATEMDVTPEERTRTLLHELHGLLDRRGRAFLIMMQDLSKAPAPAVIERHVVKHESDELPVAPIDVFQTAMNDAMPLIRPALRDILTDLRTPHTLIASLDAANKSWFQQDFFPTVLQPFGWGDVIMSIWAASAKRAVAMLLVRPLDERPFDDADRTLMTLMLRAVAPMVDREIFGKDHPIADVNLTPRQQEVLRMLLSGESKKQIAHALSRSEHTIHTYIRQIYEALGVSSRGELMAKFIDRRLARVLDDGQPITLDEQLA